jgi:hypothetical protein
MLRTVIAAVAGSMLAVWTGFGIANQEYTLALAMAAIGLWVLVESRGKAFPEAWVIAATLFGYVIGNRGFAQFSLSTQAPLLPAEVALLCGSVAVAMRRTSAFHRDSLNLTIGLWFLVGIARLWLDVRSHGALALRDFATVYYSLFFFIAQSLARNPSSLELLRRTVLATALVLPFSYLLYREFPTFFSSQLTLGGTQLIFYKDDLIAAYLFAGFFIVFSTPRLNAMLRNCVATLSYGLAFTIQSSRAAIVGLALTSVCWSLAGRRKPLGLQAIIVTLVGIGLLSLALVSSKGLEDSRIFSLYEHVKSITDVTGTTRYRSADREHVGDNNRFRAVWWRAVAEETLESNPAFGLGFGADLTDRFLRSYQLDLGGDFNVRSPHSIFFTVLGRLGIVGLVAWLAVVLSILFRAVRLIRKVARDDDALPALGFWSVSLILLASSAFGVVLEGPMGAMPFWTALGLANGSTHRACQEAEVEASGRVTAPRTVETNSSPA